MQYSRLRPMRAKCVVYTRDSQCWGRAVAAALKRRIFRLPMEGRRFSAEITKYAATNRILHKRLGMNGAILQNRSCTSTALPSLSQLGIGPGQSHLESRDESRNPREIKNHEYRVAITPAGVHELVGRGHDVVIESGAGVGSSFSDADYKTAGAQILDSADAVWSSAELLLKVKEPITEEYSRLREGQVLFTYLHLAASVECTDALLASGTTSIAYETVTGRDGSLPLLAPMSEVAGRLAPQAGPIT